MATEAVRPPTQRSLTPAGIVLGLGLGGFVDGIVLHQIAQWHNMLSSTDRWPATTLEGMEANMRGDGLFHAATWILVALGVWLLWHALRGGARGSGRELVGWMLAGWGIFNLVEGVIDHAILGLHHVREGGNELPWDLGFLALGVVMIIGGRLLVRSGERTLDQPGQGYLQSSGPVSTLSLEGNWRVERVSGFLLPVGVTKRIENGVGWTLVAGIPVAPFRVVGQTLVYRGWPIRDELEPDAGFWGGRGFLFGREFCRFRLVP